MRHERGDLGASFFFKRGEVDRVNLAKFVPTLAHQLALSIPGAASIVKRAIDADLAIVNKAIREQFEKLVRQLLMKAVETSSTPSSVVIVVDALDECEQARLDILYLVLNVPLTRQSPVRLLHLSFRDYLVNPQQ